MVDYPTGRILAEVKYRENPVIKHDDAIIELANSEKDKVLAAIVETKTSDSYGILLYKTRYLFTKFLLMLFCIFWGMPRRMGIRGKDIYLN